MAKKDDTPKIKPVLVATHIEPVTESNYFEPHAGEYHLVALKDGKEIIGSDFSVGENTFKRTFEALIGTRFSIKKNPKK